MQVGFFYKIFFVFLMSFWAGSIFAAPAKIHIMLSGSYFSLSNEGNSAADDGTSGGSRDVTKEYSYTSFAMCYEINGFCFGVNDIENVLSETTQDSTASAANNTTTTTWAGTGLMFGYFMTPAFYFNGSYFIENSRSIAIEQNAVTHTTVYNGGNAWSVDIGYLFDFKKLRFGPQVSWIHFDFKRAQADAAASEPLGHTEVDSQIIPEFALGVTF